MRLCTLLISKAHLVMNGSMCAYFGTYGERCRIEDLRMLNLKTYKGPNGPFPTIDRFVLQKASSGDEGTRRGQRQRGHP